LQATNIIAFGLNALQMTCHWPEFWLGLWNPQ